MKFWALLLSSVCWGQLALDQYSAAIEEIAQRARPSVVKIYVELRAPLGKDSPQRAGLVAQASASGSGVIVSPDGYIVTNAHVVNGARKIEVRMASGDASYPAKLIGLDRDIDLAVVKIEAASLPVLPFMDSGQLRQGQFVMAMGSPLGLQNTLTVGIVSATRRYLDPNSLKWFVQTDASINPGNSGGPLIDSRGHLVGVNTMIMTQSGGSEGIGFAIPSSVVKRIYEAIRKDGRVRRGAIGVLIEPVTSIHAKALGLAVDKGVILTDVLPGGAAAAAGAQIGDLVVSAAGRPVREGRDLLSAVYETGPGNELSLEIMRGSQKISLKVAVLEKPAERESLEEIAVVHGTLVRRLGALMLPLDERVLPLMPDARHITGVVVGAIPAEFAGRDPGIVPGDIIYAVNRRKVETVAQLMEAMYGVLKPGDAVVMEVERQRQLIYVAFELQ